MTSHVPFDTLNDYADALLPPAPHADVERHLAHCGECRAQLADLRRLLAAAAAAPRAIDPAEDLWPTVRDEISRRKGVVLPASGVGRQASGVTRRSSWRAHSLLAAAALFLVVVSSAVTTFVLRPRGKAKAAVVSAPSTPDAGRPTPSLPASFLAAERGYLSTERELRAALEAQRGTLAPETVAAVERSLRVVDLAIREAREALLRDPGNGALADIVSGNYERKLELLRRAAEFSTQS